MEHKERNKEAINTSLIHYYRYATRQINVYNSQKSDVMSELALANVEALASDEGTGCHDTNGYTAFTGKSGGAYDCCSVWVAKAPNTSEGHCH